MRYYKYIFMFVIVISLILSAACSKPQKKPAPQEQQMIGVSLPDLNSARDKAIKKAMEDNKGKQVKLMFQDAKNDAAQQELQVQQLLDKKVKVLVIEFLEPSQAMRLVEQAKGKGIKILALNNLPPNVPLDGFIGADFARVGKLQGQFILNQDQPLKQPEVLALVAQKKPAGPMGLAGLEESLSGQLNITKGEIATDNPTIAKTELMRLMSANSPGAITTSSPDLTKTLLESAIDPTLVTVGAGITKESAQALLMGVHDADVDLMPDLVGTYAVKAAEDLAKNGFWQSDTVVNDGNYDISATLVPVRLITKDNLFLVRERLGKLEAKPTEQGGQGQQSQSSGQQGQGQQSQGQGQGQGQKQGGGTKLIIETADGKKMELQIDGEIKSVQMEKGGKQQGGGGQQGGGQQSGGQQ
ncbi:substrate-binding domain-containing protein [Metallumcola ferriviriculae]|uniref:Substrate-binding domain-containing protein n=1 Tax=Metallumcola ferriviriculae TaxID=3039180 RepID=A0AAU0ULH8_9FIRM|nr:substrate-binding domain-containing protein [Desulfitibacteraceae bacterium MK1]